MDILDRARAHFENMKGKEIVIPEWGDGDAPLICTYDPPSLGLRQKIQRRAAKSDARLCAYTVIMCLKDQDGKPVFEDKPATVTALLGEADPAVVARVSSEILETSGREEVGNS